MKKNPESYNQTGKSLDFNVNQAQGPRMGNTGTPSKRAKFVEEKSGEFRTALADEVMRALEARSPGGYRDPRVEPLDANRGPKINPTANGAKLPSKYRRPISRG